MESFRKLGLIEPILKSIQEQKFEVPSEIQEKTIPFVIQGKDVIAGASTGSGKTLAFASGIIKNTKRGFGVQSLILTPTRELAEQVANSIHKFSKYKELEVTSIYGGVPINHQITHLIDADVVVGTPGRILDHLKRRTLDLRNVKILVLDEADRMLDMGFKRDVVQIIEACPKNRQTLLFSATISEDISRLARKYMNSPEEISAEIYVDPTKLTQVYYDAGEHKKFSVLVHLLKNEKSDLVMVFCNTQRNTDLVSRNLMRYGINNLAIHGGHTQEKRTRTMSNFNSKKISVLVCTDIASRGLDIKGVSHIYNYDSPKDSKEYIHRIGRTARAGKNGKVINILSRNDYENFNRILQNKEICVTKEEIPKIEDLPVDFRAHESDRRFGGNNRGSRGFGNNRNSGNRRFSGNSRSSENRRFGRNKRSNENNGNRRFSGNENRTHDRFSRNNRSERSERFGNNRTAKRFGGDRRGNSNFYGKRRN